MTEEELLALVREARPHLALPGPETEEYLSRLEERHDELHHLVERLLADDPEAAAETWAALWSFWWMRGHMSEGREFLERAAASGAGALAEVLGGLGTIAFRQGDLDAAAHAFEERYELVGPAGPPDELASACGDLARVALRRRDFAEVRRWAERGYEAAEEAEDPATIRSRSTCAPRMEGQYDDARELYLRSIELNEQLGNAINVAGENHNLVFVELRSGNREEAGRRFTVASEWIFANDNEYMRPYGFLDAGVLALHDGEDERACRLVACADRIFRDTDSIPDPDDYVELEQAVATLRERLGERFDTVWEEGRALSEDDARGLARSAG